MAARALITDVDEAYRRLRAAGYATTAAPQSLRGGATRVLYVLAPEGNVTELIEFRDRPAAPQTEAGA